MAQAKKKASKKKIAKKVAKKTTKKTAKKKVAKKTAKKSVQKTSKTSTKKTAKKTAKTAAKKTAKKAVQKTAKIVTKKTAKKTAKKTTGKKVAKKTSVAADKIGSKKTTPKSTKKANTKTMAKPNSPRQTIDPNAPAGSTVIKDFMPYKQKKDENYMNEEQIEHFRNLLLAWKNELLEEVARTVHHMRDEAANFPDPNDRATQESEFSLELRNRDRERKLIKKIDDSIGMLENNAEEYGYCDTCGIEIGVRRLEARPTATQCIDCKELDEIKERQYG